jgi:hypothetical protein
MIKLLGETAGLSPRNKEVDAVLPKSLFRRSG